MLEPTGGDSRDEPIAATPVDSAPLRVVTMVDFVVAGGGERAAVDLACVLPAANRRWFCATRENAVMSAARGRRETVDELRRAGVSYVPLGRTSVAALWQWWPLIKLLRRERVNVLHAHKLGSGFWAALVGRLCRVDLVLLHEHTPIANRGLVQRLVNRFVVAPFSDRILVVSDWSGANLVDNERIPHAMLVRFPNAIRTPVVDADARREVRAELGISADAPVLASVAMLRPEKGHDVMLRALPAIARAHPDVVLLVVGGDDPNRGYAPGFLQDVVDELGMQDHVRFLGRRSDVPRIHAAADVLVSHSREENLPIAIIEYMAAGKPIVATAVGGTPELIESEVHGLLVAPDDPAALATAVNDVLGDPDAAARCAAAARERQRAEYSLDGAGERLEALYRRLLTDKEAGR